MTAGFNVSLHCSRYQTPGDVCDSAYGRLKYIFVRKDETHETNFAMHCQEMPLTIVLYGR
jgi:hypothetical protein